MRDFHTKKRELSLWALLLLLILTAYGYKPSSYYAQNLFDKNVYVEVVVDSADPENAPFIKDELNRMVYNHFGGRIVPKSQADSQIIVHYSGSRFVPLAYENGYIVRYRADVRVYFDMITKHGKISKSIHAVQDSDIQPSSYFSSALRIEAIRKGLEKALDQFLAYASVKGMTIESNTSK